VASKARSCASCFRGSSAATGTREAGGVEPIAIHENGAMNIEEELVKVNDTIIDEVERRGTVSDPSPFSFDIGGILSNSGKKLDHD